ncbi:ATP-binding cassette domain-containing protein [Actinomadura sp. NPDC047616]|uniref:ABC transporter ATP-binding protein n=1 Tax=Actinomadura sp. NPDC047616 TaxID=3155914 RepID=UPI0033D90E8D
MIELRRLTKRYGAVRAVDDLTVTVRPARITGLIGPNGAGKTTTLRMILGLTAPTSGTATTAGRRYADLPSPMRQVGALLDPRAAHDGRRAGDHLLCLARSNGLPRWRVDEALRLVGLEQMAGRHIRVLSAGMRRRLGIAATLLGDPEVLIYDDVIGGLDAAGVAWLRSLLRRLADQGRTVLVTGHLMGEMARIADQFVVLDRGRLVADSSAEELSRRGARQRALIRCDDHRFFTDRLTAAGARVRQGTGRTLVVSGMDGADIHGLATAYGVRLHELTPQRPSLEDVLLELVQDSANGDLAAGRAA